MTRTACSMALMLSMLIATPAALAHDVYVDRAQRIVYGHLAEGPESYPASKVQSVRAYHADGSPVPVVVERRADDMSHVLATDAAVLTVDFDNGPFAKTPSTGKFQPGGREQFPDAVEVRRFVKTGKTILRFGPDAFVPKGLKLEITPLPVADLRTSTTLEFEVRYDGRPLPGATLLRDDATATATASAVTDARGRATLPFDAMRDQLYTTRNEVPGSDGIDRLSYAGALLIAVEPSSP